MSIAAATRISRKQVLDAIEDLRREELAPMRERLGAVETEVKTLGAEVKTLGAKIDRVLLKLENMESSPSRRRS